MDKNRQDIRYEELYNRLVEHGVTLHESNKKRIRAGLIFLIVFTVLMIVVRLITDSDRVVFMILWVVGMFAASIYLISVEYIDDSIRKALEDVSEREADFGELFPDSEQMREKVHTRILEKQEEIQAHYIDHWREKAPAKNVPAEKAAESEGEQ